MRRKCFRIKASGGKSENVAKPLILMMPTADQWLEAFTQTMTDYVASIERERASGRPTELSRLAAIPSDVFTDVILKKRQLDSVPSTPVDSAMLDQAKMRLTALRSSQNLETDSSLTVVNATPIITQGTSSSVATHTPIAPPKLPVAPPKLPTGNKPPPIGVNAPVAPPIAPPIAPIAPPLAPPIAPALTPVTSSAPEVDIISDAELDDQLQARNRSAAVESKIEDDSNSGGGNDLLSAIRKVDRTKLRRVSVDGNGAPSAASSKPPAQPTVAEALADSLARYRQFVVQQDDDDEWN